MKIINQSIGLILTISLLFLGCKKKEDSSSSQYNYLQCHQKVSWDSLKIKETLLGEWLWEFSICTWPGCKIDKETNKGISVIFKTNNSLEVKENGRIIRTSQWKVVKQTDQEYYIDTEPFESMLYGGILFCDKKLAFNASGTDIGCEYFKKME